MTKKISSTRHANTKEAMAGASSAAAAPTSFTREWVLNNPEAFRKLSTPPVECPVCMEPFGPDKAPLGSIMNDRPTSCRHFLCKTCWLEMFAKTKTSPFHSPICREDVTNWLGGVMDDYPNKTAKEQGHDERFKVYMANSIVMDLRFGVLEMANFGTKVFESVWGMDALAGSYTRPAASNS